MHAALARHEKAQHAQRAVPRFTGGIVVAPRNVILRARRHDRDLVRGCEMLRDQPAVPLRAAGDIGAEPVDDAGELHDEVRCIYTRVPVAALRVQNAKTAKIAETRRAEAHDGGRQSRPSDAARSGPVARRIFSGFLRASSCFRVFVVPTEPPALRRLRPLRSPGVPTIGSDTGLGSIAARAERATEAGVLDRELLDAGEQHAVQAIL